MNDNVVDLGKEKMFPVEQELYSRMMDLVYEYGGDISTVSVLGVVELVKHELIENQMIDMDD